MSQMMSNILHNLLTISCKREVIIEKENLCWVFPAFTNKFKISERNNSSHSFDNLSIRLTTFARDPSKKSDFFTKVDKFTDLYDLSVEYGICVSMTRILQWIYCENVLKIVWKKCQMWTWPQFQIYCMIQMMLMLLTIYKMVIINGVVLNSFISYVNWLCLFLHLC